MCFGCSGVALGLYRFCNVAPTLYSNVSRISNTRDVKQVCAVSPKRSLMFSQSTGPPGPVIRKDTYSALCLFPLSNSVKLELQDSSVSALRVRVDARMP